MKLAKPKDYVILSHAAGGRVKNLRRYWESGIHGKTVFLSYSLPGETLDVNIVESKSDYDNAEISFFSDKPFEIIEYTINSVLYKNMRNINNFFERGNNNGRSIYGRRF